MRHALLCAALLSGCFSPKFPEGLQCGTGDEPCPPGQVCDNGICKSMASSGDAPVDPTDRDNDGIENAVDNCPDAFNPGQYDEEFDGVGNDCDPCPFATENTDSDQDGVGDICDPVPDLPGESIVLFEGFDEPLSNGWQLAGDWAQGPSELAFQVFSDQSAIAISPLVSDGSGVAIAGVVVDTVDPATLGYRGVGVGHVSAVDGSAFTCSAGTNANGGRDLSLFESATMTQIAAVPAAWLEGTFNAIYDVQANPSFYQCGISGSTEAFVEGPYGGAAPTIGLHVRGMTGRYLWVMYIETPAR